ncbi:DUF5131 family protein [Mycobacteroides abscessus]|uniref:DUF5131 family protein n=1 Tax=Mycobacteroides abscessus TaxID=36809 RepID=UPI001485C015|nr:DUF5131 family protein [Mycobacteroides abscessus]
MTHTGAVAHATDAPGAGVDWIPAGPGLLPEQLRVPLRWRKSRHVSVCPNGDLFDADVPDDYIAHVFATMQSSAEHTFQICTANTSRMRDLLNSNRFWETVTDFGIPLLRVGPSRAQFMPNQGLQDKTLPNVWLGGPVVDQDSADRTLIELLDTPAAIRYLDVQPRGPIDLGTALGRWRPPPDHPRWRNGRLRAAHMLHWVSVEGPDTPMDPDWVRALRDQCVRGAIAFRFTGWGTWTPTNTQAIGVLDPRETYIGPVLNQGFRRIMRRVSARRSGRDLDGHTWDQYPKGRR